MKDDAPDVEQAITDAQQIYAAAIRRYGKAAQVVCHQRVAESVRAVALAGQEIEQASNRLAAAVCRRLDIENGDASKLCRMLHAVGALDPDVHDNHPGMPKHVFSDFPPRRRLDDWVVRDGRALVDSFARVGRLDLDSKLGRRLLAFIRAEKAHLEPVDQLRPPSADDRHVVARRAKVALRRAQELLDHAVTLTEEAVAVLCTPDVVRAVQKAEQAAEFVEYAMKVAGAPVLTRLGVRQREQLYERTFVDAESMQAVEQMQYGLDAGRYALVEMLAIPEARYFCREELVDRPREVLADLTRVLALPAASPELRALRATVRRPLRRTRGGSLSSKQPHRR